MDRSDPVQKQADRRTGALAGLAAALLLLVLGLALVQALRHSSAVEDCLMAGRVNCTRIGDPAAPR